MYPKTVLSMGRNCDETKAQRVYALVNAIINHKKRIHYFTHTHIGTGSQKTFTVLVERNYVLVSSPA